MRVLFLLQKRLLYVSFVKLWQRLDNGLIRESRNLMYPWVLASIFVKIKARYIIEFAKLYSNYLIVFKFSQPLFIVVFLLFCVQAFSCIVALWIHLSIVGKIRWLVLTRLDVFLDSHESIVRYGVICLLSWSQNIYLLIFCQIFRQLWRKLFDFAKLARANLDTAAHNFYSSCGVVNDREWCYELSCILFDDCFLVVIKVNFYIDCLVHLITSVKPARSQWIFFYKNRLPDWIVNLPVLYLINVIIVIRVKTMFDSVWGNMASTVMIC